MSENTQASGSRATVALKDGLGGIVGIKAGMTQVYDQNGDALAVTVISLADNVVTQVKTKDKEGYVGVQIGLVPKKESRVGKAERGHAKKSDAIGFRHYQEIRFPESAKLEGVEVGKILSADFIKEGDIVDLTAVSKGKGFQGVVKRHHFAGGMASHGASVNLRMPGSIGNRADPAKVFKNKRMAGHMGHLRVTTQNVRVVRLDLEKGVLLVHGSVPGPKTGFVTIRKAVKVAEGK